jgi:hypothetical protein
MRPVENQSLRSTLGPIVPLDHSVLCLDCEVVFSVGQPVCPRCASRHFTALARFLNRVTREASPAL